jgi:putative PIN family toxin of toxin-antitoxin system
VIVVLDANTLAPMVLASATGVLGRILAAWRRRLFVVVVSDYLLAEVRRTLANPYFSGRLTASEAQLYLSFVRILAQHVTITVTVTGVATHPEDDLVLATALSAGADYLVTGDRRFRARVPHYQGATLVSPAEFLAVTARYRGG